MAYAIAWVLYVLMAVLFMVAYERYVTVFLQARRQLRIFLRVLLALLFFTPGVVVHDDMIYLVPACVGVMFNILSHKPLGVLQAALPLLVASTVVYALLFAYEARRTGSARAGSGVEMGGDSP